jgi:hypothetical protein
MNLYIETDEILKEYNKTWDDIEFISVSYNPEKHEFSYDDKDNKTYKLDLLMFILLAKNTNYDDGYGCVEINPSLCIVGKDWWITRDAYDGSEWWNFHTKPSLPETIISVDDLDKFKNLLES